MASILNQVQKKTVLAASYTLVMFNMQNVGSSKVKILNEVLMTMPSVMYTRKNFHLLQAIDEKIENLKAAGLITFWYYRALNKQMKVKEQEPPQKLSFNHLSGCFEVWATGCLISFVVFIFEYIKLRFRHTSYHNG